MTLSLQDWHNRFMIQAQWTKALRLYFFNLLKSTVINRIMDIGCGTGALLPDLQVLTPAEIIGADISPDHLTVAKQLSPDTFFSGANVHNLPFPDDCFDIVLNHYFLMWTGNPEKALREMKRVTRDQGYLVCFAEPDYGGRLDFPEEFIRLRDYQITGILKAGADPRMGRKLKSLFYSLDLEDIQTGVYEGYWTGETSRDELESEWIMLENDLQGLLSPAELRELKKHDLAAQENGSRLIYVPTFYAWGKVKK